MVVLPRLNIFGVVPDLVLVTVIIYVIKADAGKATLFSALFGFLQDLLSAGAFINTILKVLAAAVIVRVKENYLGDEFSLVLSSVALLSGIYVIIETLLIWLVWQGNFSIWALLFRIIVSAAYNTLLVPLVYPVLKEISRGQ